MNTFGRIYYGSYWRIPPGDEHRATVVLRQAFEDAVDHAGLEDADLSDLVDELCESFDAQATFHEEGTVTIIFGRPITTVSELNNDFDEFAFLRVMDLQRGVLSDDVRKSVKRSIEAAPYALREHLSSPQFFIAWGSS